jgi:hypothetical protein
MLKSLLIASGIAALAATQAVAQSQCALTYPIFEGAIPHLDLEKCPNDVARAGAFCRVTTANDQVHVFVFEQKNPQCLLSVKSYSEYQISVK